MRWVTGSSVQAGRMMQGWLIKRFVDPDAEFLYASGEKDLSGFDATPFMVPGHPLEQRDELISHYKLTERDPALARTVEIFRIAREAYLAMRDKGAPVAEALPAGAPAECGGLATILLGFRSMSTDPAELMRMGGEVLDAVYAVVAAGRPEPIRS